MSSFLGQPSLTTHSPRSVNGRVVFTPKNVKGFLGDYAKEIQQQSGLSTITAQVNSIASQATALQQENDRLRQMRIAEQQRAEKVAELDRAVLTARSQIQVGQSLLEKLNRAISQLQTLASSGEPSVRQEASQLLTKGNQFKTSINSAIVQLNRSISQLQQAKSVA
ncbi:MAG: hypothetical protein AAFW89_12955 [Bacteroidota bacterium]